MFGVEVDVVHHLDMDRNAIVDFPAPGSRFCVSIKDQDVISVFSRRAARSFGERVCQQAAENQDSRQGLEGNAERFLQKIHLLGMEEPDRTGCDAKIQ